MTWTKLTSNVRTKAFNDATYVAISRGMLGGWEIYRAGFVLPNERGLTLAQVDKWSPPFIAPPPQQWTPRSTRYMINGVSYVAHEIRAGVWDLTNTRTCKTVLSGVPAAIIADYVGETRITHAPTTHVAAVQIGNGDILMGSGPSRPDALADAIKDIDGPFNVERITYGKVRQ